MPAESPARAVEAWMRAAGQSVASTPQDYVPARVAGLRAALMLEEAAELDAAIAAHDLAAIAHELADVVVVAYGTAATYGLDLDRALFEVMEANRSKFINGRPLLREDGKVLKGPDYRPPDMERVVEMTRIFGRTSNLPIPAHVTKQAPMESTPGRDNS